ncbi:hypothetical protein BC940DRAFT_314275 [Gongronella butleri]|nr:hypothetical protein BC940DRAFT_314275 [Gongronella butleri]
MVSIIASMLVLLEGASGARVSVVFDGDGVLARNLLRLDVCSFNKGGHAGTNLWPLLQENRSGASASARGRWSVASMYG